MPENRIDTTFAALKAEAKTAFVAYIAAGDPDIDRCLDIMHALVRAKVDVIELGVPFSDPLADGIVNQMAAQRALEAGATTPKVLDLIRRFRENDNDTPIVLFTYLNPIYTYGFEKFHTDAAAAGVDGILNLDLPPDEESENEELRNAVGLKHIRLIAPTTPDERIPTIATQGEGFIYYVCQEGVTGARTELATAIDTQVAKIQAASEIPVVVGFGISTPEQAATVAACSDGVVVGSAIVKIVAANGDQPDLADKVHDFVKPLVDATKSV